MDSTTDSVNSALKRARAGLYHRWPATDGREPPPAAGSPAEDAIAAKFASAYEAADVDALIALLTDDVFMSMPPLPQEYEGQDAVARYGHRVIPMDDALVGVTLDLGGRPYYDGPLPSALYDHWMRSFASHARMTLHIRVFRGLDRHHVVEAAFKALGLALRDALTESGTVFSTKGPVRSKS